MQGQRYSAVAHCRDTLPLSTAGILGCWALQEYLVVSHSRDAWWLGTAGLLCGWALQGYDARRPIDWALQGYFAVAQGYSAVGHCRDALPFCIAVRLRAEGTANGHCRDTQRWGIARILSGWAPQGYSANGHCKDTLRLGLSGMRCHSALQSGSVRRAKAS